jgi:hypothetical protein
VRRGELIETDPSIKSNFSTNSNNKGEENVLTVFLLQTQIKKKDKIVLETVSLVHYPYVSFMKISDSVS